MNPVPPGSLNPDPVSTSWRCNIRQEGRNGPHDACSCVPGGRGLRCAEDFDSGMCAPGQGNVGCPHAFAGASGGGSVHRWGGLRLWQDRAASSLRNPEFSSSSCTSVLFDRRVTPEFSLFGRINVFWTTMFSFIVCASSRNLQIREAVMRKHLFGKWRSLRFDCHLVCVHFNEKHISSLMSLLMDILQ